MRLLANDRGCRAAMLATTLFAVANFACAAPVSGRQTLKKVALDATTSQLASKNATTDTAGTDDEASRESGQAAPDDERWPCPPERSASYERKVGKSVEAKLILHGRVPMRVRSRGYPCSVEGEQVSMTP